MSVYCSAGLLARMVSTRPGPRAFEPGDTLRVLTRVLERARAQVSICGDPRIAVPESPLAAESETAEC